MLDRGGRVEAVDGLMRWNGGLDFKDVMCVWKRCESMIVLSVKVGVMDVLSLCAIGSACIAFQDVCDIGHSVAAV